MKAPYQEYFEHVIAEYDLLPSQETATHAKKAALPETIDAILNKYHSDPTKLTWGDLYELEKYVLAKQPADVVRSRATGLRENYREIAGQRAYEAYLQSHPAQGDGRGSTLAVRADLGRLLDYLHWAYSLIPEREQLRAKIIRNISLAVVICFVPLGVAILLFHHYGYPSVATILAVVSMGALGGFASLQQRIQKIPTEGDPILTIFELQSGGNSLYLAPPEGAIFALVLFLTFLGGLIKGGLFPDLGSWPSIDLASYGKLFVWAFIAGFAERFVPDSLNSLIARAQRPAVAVVSAPPTSKGDTVLGDHTDGAKGRRKKH